MNLPFSNIWFVDDDADEHEFFENTIHEINRDIQVTHFYNGSHLVPMLFQCVPDLLFLDLYMPGDGLSCLKKIREYKLFDKLPIIIYTGTDYYFNILYSYGYGATLCLLKQNNFTKMKEQLEQILKLDWTDQSVITEMHFQNNLYQAFEARSKDPAEKNR